MSTNGNSRDKLEEGVAKLLTECLELHSGSECLLIADDFGLPVARIIAATAASRGVLPATLVIPMQVQEQVSASRVLPRHIAHCVRGTASVITCLNDLPEYSQFRGLILDQQTGTQRLGHMPGATRRTLLRILRSDIQGMRRDAEVLATALVKGGEIEVETRSGRAVHKLTARLAGWSRPPVISVGAIAPGAWGNIPSGEVYVSPLEGTAEGAVAVDGSLLRLLVPHGEPVILGFLRGHLVSTAGGCPESRRRLKKLRELAEERGDTNWDNLAEIGVGLDQSVRRLTGHPIVDEKRRGTAHIALGDSWDFGGQVKSTIHEDMVFRRPTIRIDGRVVCRGGRVVASLADWLETSGCLRPPLGRKLERARITRLGQEIDESAAGVVRRVCRSGVGGTIAVQLGDASLSRDAKVVLDRMSSQRPASGKDLLLATGLEKVELDGALRLLEKGELVSIETAS